MAPDDVWAVGRDDVGPIIVRWNGSAWTDVPTPDRTDGFAELEAMTVAAGNELWAAGRSRTEEGDFRSLVERAPSPTQGAVLGTSNVGHASLVWTGPESGSLETEPTGDFQIGGLKAGRYQLTLALAGCTPATKALDIVAGRTKSIDFTLDCS